jgi:hypothetical protein
METIYRMSVYGKLNKRIKMKKIIKIGVAILITTSMFTGCATIIDGADQKMSFSSSPSGATVKINGKPIGVTPLNDIEVDRSDKNSTLTIEKVGYKKQDVTMKTQTNSSWYWDIAFLSLLSTTVDVVTGATNEYEKDKYFIELDKK